MSTSELYGYLCRSLGAVGANNGQSYTDREIRLRLKAAVSYEDVVASLSEFYARRGVKVEAPPESAWIYLRGAESIFRGFCVVVTGYLVLITVTDA